MVNFCTMHGKKASFLGGYKLLCVLRCVHCVSKQPNDPQEGGINKEYNNVMLLGV
jgi:hypothetical protein